MDITAKIRKTFDGEGKLKAIASIVIDNAFAVHGIKIIDSRNGIFVSMPNEKVGEEYRDICHPMTAEFREKITGAVISAYECRNQSKQAQTVSHSR